MTSEPAVRTAVGGGEPGLADGLGLVPSAGGGGIGEAVPREKTFKELSQESRMRLDKSDRGSQPRDFRAINEAAQRAGDEAWLKDINAYVKTTQTEQQGRAADLQKAEAEAAKAGAARDALLAKLKAGDAPRGPGAEATVGVPQGGPVRGQEPGLKAVGFTALPNLKGPGQEVSGARVEDGNVRVDSVQAKLPGGAAVGATGAEASKDGLKAKDWNATVPAAIPVTGSGKDFKLDPSGTVSGKDHKASILFGAIGMEADEYRHDLTKGLHANEYTNLKLSVFGKKFELPATPALFKLLGLPSNTKTPKVT